MGARHGVLRKGERRAYGRKERLLRGPGSGPRRRGQQDQKGIPEAGEKISSRHQRRKCPGGRKIQGSDGRL